MKLSDALALIKPLLWEGIKMYAPQIKIPADIIRMATGKMSKVKKATKQTRKRVNQIDDMITEMEDKLNLLKNEREEWVLQWGDLDQLVDYLQKFRPTGRGVSYDGRPPNHR
jgi:hypothetical protein